MHTNRCVRFTRVTPVRFDATRQNRLPCQRGDRHDRTTNTYIAIASTSPPPITAAIETPLTPITANSGPTRPATPNWAAPSAVNAPKITTSLTRALVVINPTADAGAADLTAHACTRRTDADDRDLARCNTGGPEAGLRVPSVVPGVAMSSHRACQGCANVLEFVPSCRSYSSSIA
jgi:hypothetical protein